MLPRSTRLPRVEQGAAPTRGSIRLTVGLPMNQYTCAGPAGSFRGIPKVNGSMAHAYGSAVVARSSRRSGGPRLSISGAAWKPSARPRQHLSIAEVETIANAVHRPPTRGAVSYAGLLERQSTRAGDVGALQARGICGGGVVTRLRRAEHWSGDRTPGIPMFAPACLSIGSWGGSRERRKPG
jgi:hypothetical protein